MVVLDMVGLDTVELVMVVTVTETVMVTVDADGVTITGNLTTVQTKGNHATLDYLIRRQEVFENFECAKRLEERRRSKELQ